MKQPDSNKITLYTSNWCAQAIGVQGFLQRNQINVNLINIDEDPEAREELIKLNGGFASVPTLVFPDGTKLTEPSFSELRKKLQLKPSPGLISKIRALLGKRAQ